MSEQRKIITGWGRGTSLILNFMHGIIRVLQ